MAPTIDPQDAAYLATTDPEHLPHDTAVAVRVEGDVVVRDFPARTISTEAVPVTVATGAVRVLPHAPNRVRAIVQAIGGTAVVGGHRGITSGSGYALAAGATLVVIATAEVWAVADATTPSTAVHVYTEHRDG